MAIESLAVLVVNFLAPYLAKGGEEFAKKAGAEMFEKAHKLYEYIGSKFSGNSFAESTLTRFAEKPDSEGRRASTVDLLDELMTKEPNFHADLERLMGNTEQVSVQNVFAMGKQSVAIGGDLHGGVTFGDTTNRKSAG